LTALASDAVTNSEYGEQIIDTFATAETSEKYDEIVKSRANEIYKNDSAAESKNNQNF
jgi:hypothetical protein